MSFLMRQVAHCDVCGHEWLTQTVPKHCAKCKSRKWNQLQVEVVHIPRSEWPKEVQDAFAPKALEQLKRNVGMKPAPAPTAVPTQPHLARPAHAAGCHCLMCKPA